MLPRGLFRESRGLPSRARQNLLGLRLRVEQRGARHLVAAVGLNEPHALGASSGLANLAGLDAYELAVLGDDHHLGLFVDGEDGDDLAGLLRRLHVDDALAAAPLQAIGCYRRLLAEAALRNAEHALRIVRRNGGERDYVVAFAQVFAAHAARRA